MTTIPSASRLEPVPSLTGNLAIVDPRTGLPTQFFLLLMEQWRAYALGAARVIPCSCLGENVGGEYKVTLTPNDASPLLTGYRDYDCFVFVADATSSADITRMTVAPVTGTLATLKAYSVGGATPAIVGDLQENRFYQAWYSDHLDLGAGGFVLNSL